MRRWIGIDPGVTGAVVVITAGGITGCRAEIFDTPYNRTGGRRVLSPWHMAQILSEHPPRDVALVVIEKAQPMPKQGVVSVFNYGRGYGLWEGIIVALGLPYVAVGPRTWKNRLLADTAKDKQASLQLARQLFPGLGDQLSLAKHHGRAEALLLAYYAKTHVAREE